jgi:pSer/pThr/pTyr-binding forkhead associated (FHA) protein
MSPDELALLRKACNAAGPLEIDIISRGHGSPTRGTIELPFLLLGRGPKNTVVLNNMCASRRHAYLQLIHGRLFFVDLGSRTGILHNGELAPQGWLDPGQQLQIGPFTLQLPMPADGPAPAAAAATGNPTERMADDLCLAPGVTLEICGGQGRHVRWQVNRVLTLAGTAAECKIRLAERGVSEFHCSFLHTSEGVWVIDLLSRRGTVLNGKHVRWARLADGDKLQLGSCLVRPWYDQPGPTTLPALAAPPGPPAEFTKVALRCEGPFAPVLEQFNSIQQQMFDQYHQAMVTLVQMFGEMHRDQMGVIREELDRLQQVACELSDLQSELRKHAPASLSAQTTKQKASAVPGTNGIASHPPAAASSSNGAHLGSPRVAAAHSSPSTSQLNGPPADSSIHLWLSRRIAALQEERQGRWQKILEFMMGK